MAYASKCRCDYYGYGREWLTKSDLTPKTLRRFGILANTKEIQAKADEAHDGWVATGGHGWVKHSKTYSISALREIFKK